MDSYSQSPNEILTSHNNVNHELEVGDDDRRRLNVNKKWPKDPTPSSSCRRKRSAKGAGANIVNQLDKLIEVVSTMQLAAHEGTVIYTPVVLLVPS
ncbi:hypothetical protein MRB53_010426 [Persea americana]|uniref:Uncharacterized protein n=1 Tax=Persea americana TaxID=3435 RepID=A0ACC2LRU1_PERAE|nr:hypothetical protein MRB53_010426 [Persea americana]